MLSHIGNRSMKDIKLKMGWLATILLFFLAMPMAFAFDYGEEITYDAGTFCSSTGSYGIYEGSVVKLMNGKYLFFVNGYYGSNTNNDCTKIVLCDDILDNSTCQVVASLTNTYVDSYWVLYDFTNVSCLSYPKVAICMDRGNNKLYCLHNTNGDFTSWQFYSYDIGSPYIKATPSQQYYGISQFDERWNTLTSSSECSNDNYGKNYPFWTDYNDDYFSNIKIKFNSDGTPNFRGCGYDVCRYSPSNIMKKFSPIIQTSSTTREEFVIGACRQDCDSDGYDDFVPQICKIGYNVYSYNDLWCYSIGMPCLKDFTSNGATYDFSAFREGTTLKTLAFIIKGNDKNDGNGNLDILVGAWHRDIGTSFTTSSNWIYTTLDDSDGSWSWAKKIFWFNDKTFFFEAYKNNKYYIVSCTIDTKNKALNCNPVEKDKYGETFTHDSYDFSWYDQNERVMYYIDFYPLDPDSDPNHHLILRWKVYKYTVKLDVKNEITLEPTTAKLTFYGENTTKVIDTEVGAFYYKPQSLPSGGLTLKAENSNSPARYYYVNINGSYEQTFYLLDNNNGLYYTIYVTDLQNNPIQGAKVTIQGYDSDKEAWVTFAQFKTNPDGSSTFFLRPSYLYKVKIEKENYVNMYFDFIPDPNIRTIYIRLSTSGGGGETGGEARIELNTLFDTISWDIQPDQYYQTNNLTIKYIISDSNSSLEYFKMDVWLINGTQEQLVYSNTITDSPQGGEIQYFTNQTGKYKVQACFKLQNQDEYCHVIKEFFLYVAGSEEINVSELVSPFTYWLIAVLITGLVVGFFARFVGIGAGFIGLGVLGLFIALNPSITIAGISGWHIFLLTAIVVIAIIFLKSYI